MMHWLSMGGYAAFVWPAYLVTILVVGLNIRWARSAARQARDEARRRILAGRSGP